MSSSQETEGARYTSRPKGAAANVAPDPTARVITTMLTRANAAHALPAERVAALASLHEAIRQAVDLGHVVPCREGLPSPVAWISDVVEEQALAARACLACPALHACHRAAAREVAGVWAGQVRRGSVGNAHRPGKPGAVLPRATHAQLLALLAEGEDVEA